MRFIRWQNVAEILLLLIFVSAAVEENSNLKDENEIQNKVSFFLKFCRFIFEEMQVAISIKCHFWVIFRTDLSSKL